MANDSRKRLLTRAELRLLRKKVETSMDSIAKEFDLDLDISCEAYNAQMLPFLVVNARFQRKEKEENTHGQEKC